MQAYYEIPGLESVYLEDSFVLSVTVRPGTVEFVVDTALTESHPEYAPPRKDEQYCYRLGRLRFSNVRQVHWEMETVRPTIDPTGEIDYGEFDRFTVEGDRYLLGGDFGQLDITAASCEFELDPPPDEPT